MKANMATQSATQTDVSDYGLRAQLIAVALEILNRDGIEALTLRAVARGAGVSHGAPARHFDNLDDLKAEVAAEGYKVVAEGIRAADAVASKGADPKKPLIAAVRAYVNFARDNPGLFALIIRTGTLGGGKQNLAARAALVRGPILAACASSADGGLETRFRLKPAGVVTLGIGPWPGHALAAWRVSKRKPEHQLG